jgi:uncharacterized repeat protein (TIGR01451 family)
MLTFKKLSMKYPNNFTQVLTVPGSNLRILHLVKRPFMLSSGLTKISTRTHRLCMWVFLLALAPQLSWAAGLTPAGTIISNVATVNYTLASVVQPPLVSAAALVTVDEVVQPVLTWQDAAPVAVGTPSTNDVLQFLLTNAGNGQEAFSLARTNGPLPLPAGNYTPLDGSIGSIYLESNGTPGFQPTDTAYMAGSNDPNLAPNSGQIIYVISDTPVVANNIHGEVKLDAASLTPGVAGAVPGTSFAGLGTGGVFAVTGTGGGQASSTGSYITSGLGVVVNKIITSVVDPNGGPVVMPGSVVTYQISVALTGTGTATNLVINDPLPAATTFVSGSLYLNGVLQADAVANTINVSLGNVPAPANHVITFQAKIN